MKKGDMARVKAPVIQGTISGRRFNPDDQVEYLLVWQEGDDVHHRWFGEGELEPVEPPEQGAAA